MRRWCVLATMVIASCAGSGGAAKKAAVGLEFEIDLYEEGTKKMGRDRLLIDSGLESVEGRKLGYMKAPIDVDGNKGNFSFKAVTKTAAGHEEKVWTGKVEGDRIEGFYIWMRRNKPPVKVTFDGKIVVPPEPKPIPAPEPPRLPPPAVPTPSTPRPR